MYLCEGYSTPVNMTHTEGQAREALLDQENDIEFLRSSELEDFVFESQPNDETRHQIALLKFPAELGLKFTSHEFVTGDRRQRHNGDSKLTVTGVQR
jgi:acyl-coenzyme A thioesterase PaaI-like protein